MINTVFFGYGDLAYSCLLAFVEFYKEPIVIYTHFQDEHSNIISFANKREIPIKFSNPNDDFENDSSAFKKSDLLLSINYKNILNSKLLASNKYKINLHGSLLPKYRGRSPHIWAIINGESQTGVTAHIMDDGIDTGPVLYQESVVIEASDTGASLLDKFNKIYPRIMLQGIKNLLNNEYQIQDDSEGSFFGKRTPIMSYIDINKSKLSILNFIRALGDPYPPAYFFMSNGKKVLIKKADYASESIENLEILFHDKNKLYLKCSDGLLEILEYIIE